MRCARWRGLSRHVLQRPQPPRLHPRRLLRRCLRPLAQLGGGAQRQRPLQLLCPRSPSTAAKLGPPTRPEKGFTFVLSSEQILTARIRTAQGICRLQTFNTTCGTYDPDCARRRAAANAGRCRDDALPGSHGRHARRRDRPVHRSR